MLDKLEKKFDANTFAMAVESKVKIILKPSSLSAKRMTWNQLQSGT